MLAVTESQTYNHSTSCSRRRSRRGSRPKNTSYFEVDLASPDDADFYGGFSGDVMGIFIPTFNLKSIGDSAAIKLTFTDRSSIAIAGCIEWIREFNPMVPDTQPGLGIRFVALDTPTRHKIMHHMDGRPCLFYEDSPPVSIDANHESLAPSIDHSSATDGFSLDTTDPVVAELLRNILSLLHYMDIAPDTWTTPEAPRLAADQHAAPVPKTGGAIGEVVPISAVIVSAPVASMNFHGGFRQEDTGHRIFVATETPHAIGTRLSVHLRRLDGRHLTGQGEVKWIRRHNPLVSKHVAPPGMGICLTEILAGTWQSAFPNHSDARTPVICEMCGAH